MWIDVENEISGIPRNVGVDIICLTETKMDGLDSFDFDGFTYFMKNRSIYKRKSGEVGGRGDSIAVSRFGLAVRC